MSEDTFGKDMQKFDERMKQYNTKQAVTQLAKGLNLNIGYPPDRQTLAKVYDLWMETVSRDPSALQNRFTNGIMNQVKLDNMDLSDWVDNKWEAFQKARDIEDNESL